MTSPLRCDVLRRYPVALVVVAGVLRLDTVATLRAAVLKVLADRPTALVIDMAGVAVVEPTAATVVTVLERHAETWADAALLLAAPSAALCRELTRLGLRPPIYPSRAAALTAAALTPVPARVRLPFGVDVTAPAAARHAARAACGRWNLSSSLAQRATQVVTELVTNTVQHARTEGTLLLWRRQAFLHLSVRDGSRSPPVLYEPAAPAESGYGLRLVDALSSGWGVRMVPDGKVVWATLRTWSHVE